MNCTINVYLVIAIIIIISVGYVYLRQTKREGFGSRRECPNLLIKKGNAVYLYKTNKANIPGINPVRFNNLEEYVEFLNWERSQGINCPVLFLEHTYTTQNKRGYKVLTDLSHLTERLPIPKQREEKLTLLQDGMRSSSGKYNQNLYPFYDPLDQRVGSDTPLDHISLNQSGKSVDAMSPDWAGKAYTEAAVKGGEFKEDEVRILVNQD